MALYPACLDVLLNCISDTADSPSILMSLFMPLSTRFFPAGRPGRNGAMERFFLSLKQECVWLHKFESFEQAEAVIAHWIQNYNKNRLHSLLEYKIPEKWRKKFYELPQTA